MGHRYHSAAAALFAAVVLATGSLEAMAQSAPAHVPRTLPTVQRITMPQPPAMDRAAAYLLGLSRAQNAVRHTTGEEPMPAGNAASPAQLEALMRARSEQAARFKALHPAGVDASP